VICGFEQAVLQQGGLLGQGEIEEPGLVLGWGEMTMRKEQSDAERQLAVSIQQEEEQNTYS